MEDPIPIKELLDTKKFRDKMVVMGVKGKITAIYKETTGDGQHGPYSYQNADIVGDDGGKIRLSFSNCSQPLSAKGKVIQIGAFEHATHGWIGLKIKDNSFERKKGNTTEQVNERVIQVSSTAEILYDGAQPTGEAGGGTQTSGGGQPHQQQSHVSDRHPALVLSDIGALHGKCVDFVNETYGDKACPEYVATIFIEASRQGCVHEFIKRMGTAVPSNIPPPPTDPSKWREGVMPKGEFIGKTLEELPDEKLLELHDALDKAKSNSDFAECVYQAASDRNVLPPPKQPDPAKPTGKTDQPEDDIPF